MENTMSEVTKQHSFFSEFKKLANFKSFFFELREKKKKKNGLKIILTESLRVFS